MLSPYLRASCVEIAACGPFDLVGHGLADVVEQRRPLGGLDAHAELGGHDARQMTDLERMLEDVLAVARPVAQPSEHLDQLVVHLPAIRLEHRLLARQTDMLLDLGFRLVVHLLDPRGVDPAVLDELHQRLLRDLPAHTVERREDDGLRGVVDDELDAGQVLESADVTSLPADDPSLHVIRGQLHERDRGLGGVACRDSLKGVGNEVPGTLLRFRLRLLLDLANHASHLVAHQLL